MVAIIAKHLKIENDVAAHAAELEVGPNGGLAKDANFDMVGFKSTLRLRAELEGGDPNAARGCSGCDCAVRPTSPWSLTMQSSLMTR